MNQIVARFQDGRMLKGLTSDFFPAKDHFHLVPQGSPPGTKPTEIRVTDLKALFFVRDFTGHSEHQEKTQPPAQKPPGARAIRVVFKDGETLVGTTQGYQPNRPGFFVVPVDAGSNNERCYVVTASTREITLL